MTTKPTLLILAAGIGSRYGGLKQIDPVGPAGEKVIDYSIFDALRSGFAKVVFVIRRDIEAAFREAIGKNWEPRTEVAYAFQELNDVPQGCHAPAGRAKPWGTAHAIRAGRHHVAAPFAAINADDFYGREAFRALAEYLRPLPPNATDQAMVAFTLRQTLSEHGSVSRGVCRCDANGYLVQIEEHTRIESRADGIVDTGSGTPIPLTGAEPVSMNCWGFAHGFFADMEEAFRAFFTGGGDLLKAEWTIPGTVDALIHSGRIRVKVLHTPARWLGVTYREDKPRVSAGIQELVRAEQYPPSLWIAHAG